MLESVEAALDAAAVVAAAVVALLDCGLLQAPSR
jgi:hypothetical protein